MNKILPCLFALFIPLVLPAAEWTGLSSSVPVVVHAQVVSTGEHETVLELQLAGFNRLPVTTPHGQEWKITAPGLASLLQAGAPDLPKAAASVIIPDHANMEVQVSGSEYVDYPGIALAPSRGSLLRTVNPGEVPYTYGDAYQTDAFYPGRLAELRKPFIVRDFRGQAVWIYPFQYNPVTKVLRVYTSLRIRIYENGTGGGNMLVRRKPLASIDPEYAQIYRSLFRNGNNVVSYTPLSEDGDMLVISPAAYAPALQPFLEWKARRGLKCELVDVAAIGNNANSIRTYIANYYATHDLKYVLIVGDDGDVATPSMSGGASDPSYGFLAGNDSYAEVMVGRFSVSSVADVQTLVQRSVEYEANPTPGGTWYRKATGIASNLGPGDDGEMDWEHERNIRDDLMNYGYTDVDELYDGTHGIVDAAGDPGIPDLVSVINAGRSVINYTGHGSQTACVTTGFSTTDVPQLTNTGMLPFWWSVGCVHGEFNGGTCFAEVLTRAQYNGQPSGMVATFMSSINQYWDEPMDAQDEFDSLLTDSRVNNIKRTYGGISVNGCMKMNDTYGTTGDDMTNTWHVFGDPSLVIRNNVPFAITATHLSAIPVGSSQLAVTCNTNGAMVSLTKGANIISKGPVAGNSVTLTFPALSLPDTLTLTATAFNGIPYSAQVLVIPSSGPYVVYASSTVDDVAGNGDGLPDYGESIDLDVTLQNVGLGSAGSVNAVLSTTDPYVTITQNTAAYGAIAAGSQQPYVHAFSYTIASNVPDQHVIAFDLTVTDSAANTWPGTLLQVVNAPSLHISSILVDDATGNNDGFLDPGETANTHLTTINTGHSASPPAIGTLTSSSPYVTINSGISSMGSIPAGGNFASVLNVSLAPNITFGSLFDLTYNVAASAYSVSHLFSLSAGEILEDFETNNFQKFNWVQGGQSPWMTTTAAPFQGTYCAQSGPIGNNQMSTLSMQITVLAADSVSFYEKVSSEATYDFLRFYLDNVKLGEWSGNEPWTYRSYYVPTGVHTLRWAYEKDLYQASGMDAAWLDNIKLPPMVLPTSVHDVPVAGELSLYPNPVSDVASLTLSSPVPVKADARLYDMQGALVQVICDGRQVSGTETIHFSTASLARGVYVVQVEAGDNRQSVRLVK